MKALLRYMIVKSARERFLAWILFAPAVLVFAPVGGLLVRSLLIGQRVYPFSFEDTSHDATMVVFIRLAIMVAVIDGGIAAFWILRKEIADRSIASFVLAAKPLTIWIVAILYGTAAGLLASLIALPVLSLITFSSLPGIIPLIASAALATLTAATFAALFASISSDLAMLVPLLFTTLFFSILIFQHSLPFMIGAAVAVLTLPIVASFFLERRCAS
jgi:hypothetical protein